jgi:hypothetical protein
MNYSIILLDKKGDGRLRMHLHLCNDFDKEQGPVTAPPHPSSPPLPPDTAKQITRAP